MIKGKLITFEGIDKCGKTTQIDLLYKHLLKQYSRDQIMITQEPGGTLISDKIRNILLDKEHVTMKPLTEFFLYLASRNQHIEEFIIPNLDQGKIILCDRFYDSTYAYQRRGRKLSSSTIKSNAKVTHNIIPDLTFFIDISIDEMFKRKNYSTSDRVDNNTRKFFHRVQRAYLKMNTVLDRMIYVDGSKSKTEISENIIDHTKKIL